MNFHQHILDWIEQLFDGNQAERMLAAVLPGVWSPAVSAAPGMLSRHAYSPLFRGTHGQATDGLCGHQTHSMCGFKAESTARA